MSVNINSRMRGFNLLGMFCDLESSFNRGRAPGYFAEEDFKMIHDFGFNFVRLPLSYRVWGSADDLYYINPDKLARLDDAVEYAEKYDLHINIAMHRAPGYCVNYDETEKLDLWSDQEALKAFMYHFRKIAERYTHVSIDRLSYNIINEPRATVSSSQYTNVCWHIIDEIRSFDLDRYFMVDGLNWGRDLHMDMLRYREKNIIYSGRGYEPAEVTHYGAEWRKETYEDVPVPVWPEKNYRKVSDARGFWYGSEELKQDIDVWGAAKKIYGVPMMFGEIGVYNKTPHDVALRWLEDLLINLKRNNLGWAMWNLYERMGVFDSGRSDVVYEDYYGHKLDRKMLDLLMKY